MEPFIQWKFHGTHQKKEIHPATTYNYHSTWMIVGFFGCEWAKHNNLMPAVAKIRSMTNHIFLRFFYYHFYFSTTKTPKIHCTPILLLFTIKTYTSCYKTLSYHHRGPKHYFPTILVYPIRMIITQPSQWQIGSRIYNLLYLSLKK